MTLFTSHLTPPAAQTAQTQNWLTIRDASAHASLGDLTAKVQLFSGLGLGLQRGVPSAPVLLRRETVGA